jgi:hypothetical protein
MRRIVPLLAASAAWGCHTNGASFRRTSTPDCNADSPEVWSTGDVGRRQAGGLWAESDEVRVELGFGSCVVSFREDVDVDLASDGCGGTVSYREKVQCEGILCSFGEDYKEWFQTGGVARIRYDADSDTAQLDLDATLAVRHEQWELFGANVATGSFGLRGTYDLGDLDF